MRSSRRSGPQVTGASTRWARTISAIARKLRTRALSAGAAFDSTACQSTGAPSRIAAASSASAASSSPLTLHLPREANERALRGLAGGIGGRLLERQCQLAITQAQFDASDDGLALLRSQPRQRLFVGGHRLLAGSVCQPRSLRERLVGQ